VFFDLPRPATLGLQRRPGSLPEGFAAAPQRVRQATTFDQLGSHAPPPSGSRILPPAAAALKNLVAPAPGRGR
jgi:hypothetical protein